MAKKFHAEHIVTGERWKPKVDNGYGVTKTKEYLILYDSGKLGVVKEDFYTHITPLSSDYKLVKHKGWDNL